MSLLPDKDNDNSLLSGFVFGKQLAQAEKIVNLEHQGDMDRIRLGAELSRWKNYARSLENALNEVKGNLDGVAAARDALLNEGQGCPHHEHHKLSHDKGIRSSIYEKAVKGSEPIIKKPFE